MIKSTICLLLLSIVLCRNYPMFKQCDDRWRNQQLGTSSATICSAGCAMSSVAMGLAGIGKNFNPSSLNQWLKAHGGYVSGNLIVWGSVSPLGLGFRAKVANSQIRANLDAGNVVVMNVHNGGHWVLATHYTGSTIYVNDPGYNTGSYDLSQIVDGQNVVYAVVGTPGEQVMNAGENYQHLVLGHSDK